MTYGENGYIFGLNLGRLLSRLVARLRLLQPLLILLEALGECGALRFDEEGQEYGEGRHAVREKTKRIGGGVYGAWGVHGCGTHWKDCAMCHVGKNECVRDVGDFVERLLVRGFW